MTSVKVIIAGGGIAGLSLAIFLEHAANNIQYVVLERAREFKVLGSSIALSPQVLRVFDQLGLLQELDAISLPLIGVDYLNQDMNKVGAVDTSHFEERYGYHNRFFERPKLIRFLLSKVPPGKILWGKKVQSTVESEHNVKVICEDASEYTGDVLIGADGAYSMVRHSMYKHLKEKGIEVSDSDLGPLNFNEFAILGVTTPMDGDDKYPALKEDHSRMSVVLASEQPFVVYVRALKGGVIGWTLLGKLLAPKSYKQEMFSFSEWEAESIDDILTDIGGIAVPLGDTIGNLIKHSTNISKIMLEDKLFTTWYSSRTCLVGDAAHKLVPAGGQGANQSILDVICLANLLHELPSTATQDFEKMFSKYYEIRFQSAKKAMEASHSLGKLIGAQGFLSSITRSLILNLPTVMTKRLQDGINGGRPILHYIPAIDDKGTVPDSSPLPPFLSDTTSA